MANDIAWQVNALAMKARDLDLIPGVSIKDGRRQSDTTELFSDSHLCVTHAYTSPVYCPLTHYSMGIQEGAPGFYLIQIQNNLLCCCLPYLSELAFNVSIILIDLLLRVAEKLLYLQNLGRGGIHYVISQLPFTLALSTKS